MSSIDQMPAESGRASRSPVYVYGVTTSGARLGGTKGLADATVDLVEHGEVAAIASIAPPTLRAKRRDVLRHTEVLQKAVVSGTVLPLAFGIVFATQASVVDDFLAPRYEELVGLLQHFEGMAELNVRTFYREEAVLAEIVRDERRIAELREATRSSRAPEALRVELGESVARALDARRARDADAILSTLLPLARDVAVEERRAEYEVLRASFLVDVAAIERFDARMEDLAREQHGRMLFKYTGPLPPHSFVALRGA
jgi:hypothetical protein